MPHLVIDCSQDIRSELGEEAMLSLVHAAAVATEEFGEGDIKARARWFDKGLVGGKQNSFVHVALHLLSGRTPERKKEISMAIAEAVASRLPNVKSISVDVQDMDRETYSKIVR